MSLVVQLAPLAVAPDYEKDKTIRITELWTLNNPSAWLTEHRDDVRVLITTGSAGASEALMASLPNLGLIANFGVGLDAVDLNAARARNITVTHTPGILTHDVADLAILLMLASLRHLPQAHNFASTNHWEKGPFGFGRSTQGLRLGIFGMGRIGHAIARRAEAFDMTIGYCTRSRRESCVHRYFSSIAELATWSDVLMLSAPGGAETRNVVDMRVLHALGEKGVLVNIARGSLVDEGALTESLYNGTIAGAALDVFASEPSIPERLRLAPNLVMSPHIASATIETRRAMADHVMYNVKSFLSGLPLKDIARA